MIRAITHWLHKRAAATDRDAQLRPLQARLSAARSSHKATQGIEAELRALTLSALKAGA